MPFTLHPPLLLLLALALFAVLLVLLLTLLLSYLVSSSRAVINAVHAFKIQIQSAVKDPVFLWERIVSFLTQFRQATLETLTDEMFNNYKQALHTQLVEKNVALGSETDRHWDEIAAWRYQFDYRKFLPFLSFLPYLLELLRTLH
jgi:hypothetical protein